MWVGVGLSQGLVGGVNRREGGDAKTYFLAFWRGDGLELFITTIFIECTNSSKLESEALV